MWVSRVPWMSRIGTRVPRTASAGDAAAIGRQGRETGAQQKTGDGERAVPRVTHAVKQDDGRPVWPLWREQPGAENRAVLGFDLNGLPRSAEGPRDATGNCRVCLGPLPDIGRVFHD